MITYNSMMNPTYGAEETASVEQYINSGGWIMEHTKTREMEQQLCDYTGAQYAHMVPSGTSALLVAAMLANIKPGSRFAASAYTQAATVNGAILMGGVPVFVDVDATGTIDFAKIPEDCGVVFVSSINGRYCEDIHNKIKQLQSRGVFVVEDTAQSLGSWSYNQHHGTFGDVGIFSFGAPKIVTTGQGGAIITNNKQLSEQIFAIKNFGRTVGVGEVYNIMGMNFKFTDLQASFGVEQMRKLPEYVAKKQQIFTWYKQCLGDVVDFVETHADNTATVTYPDIYLRSRTERDGLCEYLRTCSIGTRAVYDSLGRQPFHSQWATSCPVTEVLGDRGLQLPGQVSLEHQDILSIGDAVKLWLSR
jgi:perosamine synthetase